MFFDLFEALRNRWRSTYKPALQSLFSEKRSLFALFLASLLLETMLCMLFFAHQNNLGLQGEMMKDIRFEEVLLNKELHDTHKVLSETVADSLDTFKGKILGMEITNHAIFVFAVCVWFGVAAFVFARMISSTVELKKLIFGLYITFGANTKKIRRLIFAQMFTLGIAALLPAILSAMLICNIIYGSLVDEALSKQNLLSMLAVIVVMLLTVIGGVARKTTANTCVSLLAAADISDIVKSPRGSVKGISADRPFRLARISVTRMRGHYLTLILSGTLPAVLFFCCMSLAMSDEIRGKSGVLEYSYLFENGIPGSQFEDAYRNELESIPGISSAVPRADAYCFDDGYIFLTDLSAIADPDNSLNVSAYGGFAWDSVKIVCGDLYSMMQKNLYPEAPLLPDNSPAPPPPGCNPNDHVGIFVPEEGHVTLVYPESLFGLPDEPYHTILPTGEPYFVSYGKPDAADMSLADKFSNRGYAGVTFAVESFCARNTYLRDAKGHLILDHKGDLIFEKSRLDEEVLILHPSDYQKLTGIDAASNIQRGVPSPVLTLAEIGSYLIASGHGSSPESGNTPVSPLRAGNDLYFSVADRYTLERLELSADTLLPDSAGHATLVLRKNYSFFNENVQKLYLSGAVEINIPYPQNLEITLEGYLRMRLSSIQHYTACNIDTVVYSDKVEHDTLLLSPEDISTVLEQRYAYTRIEVSVDPEVSVKDLCNQVRMVEEWVTTPNTFGDPPKLQHQNKIWDVMLIHTYRYNGILRTLAVLLALAVPFIWFTAQYNHYRKRKSDLDILNAIGITHGGIFRLFLAEGLILALICALLTCILCPIFTIVAYVFFIINGFPFAYSALDVGALFAVTAFSALCAFLTTIVNFLFLYTKKSSRTK